MKFKQLDQSAKLNIKSESRKKNKQEDQGGDKRKGISENKK